MPPSIDRPTSRIKVGQRQRLRLGKSRRQSTADHSRRRSEGICSEKPFIPAITQFTWIFNSRGTTPQQRHARQREPNRFRGFYGAARAAEGAGDREKAALRLG